MLSRRGFLKTSLVAGSALAFLRGPSGSTWARDLGPKIQPAAGKTVSVALKAAERQIRLPAFGGQSLPMWTYADGQWPPIIRVNLGDRLSVRLENQLSRPGEHTSIHWHGIRLENSQDGVPYLVQSPVMPGENFTYNFVPPDTGTFFFHSHCNTAEQLGRGLVGVLIVDGDTTDAYDSDNVILLHDWRADLDDNKFSTFSTQRGASRAGTYGAVRSANGAVDPAITLPAGGDCRLRIVNTDPTRILSIGVAGAQAAIIAVDGVAVVPFPLATWELGPAMRIDVVVRAPASGKMAELYDDAQPDRYRLARLVGGGETRRQSSFDPKPLRAGLIAEPNMANAQHIAVNVSESDSSAVLFAANAAGINIDDLCVTKTTFWSINGRAWPDRDHAKLPPPMLTLERGRSYLFAIKNTTPFSHPIHFHGHTFKVLAADNVSRPVHHADTVLVHPEETVEVAFVADNPGDWMFHCHIIEHQETGMMGYLHVT